VPAGRVDVLPNPAPSAQEAVPFEVGPAPVLAFAGRLTAQKDLGVALAALRGLPAVRLLVAGEGPEAGRLAAEAPANVAFLGPLPRREVLGLLRGADAAVLTSAWENFPHGVVEALAVGTPVIATRTGGVAEIVRDGENGLLVPAGDPEAFAAAIRRFLDDDGLRERLRAAAAGSVERFAPAGVYGRLEEILERAAARR
jgi:glycosyltransferase involved in cell wall biosynthesis